jgi:hypothetical protein
MSYERTDGQSLINYLSSAHRRVLCHYCDEMKCPCCLVEVNYYYNYGLSRRKIMICADCYYEIYGAGRKISPDLISNAFTKICETIANLATLKIGLGNRGEVNYFDAVKKAFDRNQEVRTYLGEHSTIDKNLRGLWSVTYAITTNKGLGMRVLKRDPDELLLEVDGQI